MENVKKLQEKAKTIHDRMGPLSLMAKVVMCTQALLTVAELQLALTALERIIETTLQLPMAGLQNTLDWAQVERALNEIETRLNEQETHIGHDHLPKSMTPGGQEKAKVPTTRGGALVN